MEDRWNRLWSIFHALRETPSEHRDDSLARLCAGDPSLRDEVKELLRADAAGMNPLDVLPVSARGLTAAPSLGEMVGRYKLVSMLGQGGMGVVYAAEQEEPVRRKAAVKILRNEYSGPREQARFEAEHQALAMLSHPNIAQVYDGGTANGHLFIAMEYVEGSAFTAACDAKKLGIRDRIRLFVEVCEAIQHAHQRGVIHRDLKPSNVLITQDADRAIPKVIDFGIAKGVGVRLSSESIETRAGTLLGTPEYMSPEQAMSGDIDTRSDVYALGTMLYELVCGALPFDLHGVDLMHALWMVSHEDPATPSARFASLSPDERERIATARSTTPEELERSLRGEIDWIATKAMEKDPSARYVSAGEFGADLGRLLEDHPVLAGPPSGTYRLKKYIRRHRAGAAAVAGVAAALVLGIIGTSWMATVASRQRDAAQTASNTAQKEAAVSKATVEFVNEMLASPDPSADRSAPGVRDVRVVDILDRAEKDLDRSLGKQPEVAASLRHTLGKTYYGLGLYDRAKVLLEKAYADRTRLLGAEHPDTLTAQHDLATTYGRLNDTERAGRLIRNTYLTRRRVLGVDHPDTIAALDSLGAHQTRIGEFKAAESMFREASERFRRVLGPEDRRTLAAMSNLSYALSNHSQLEESVKLGREVLNTRRRIFGPDHMDTIQASSNLAATLVPMGKTDEAAELLRGSLAGFINLLGAEHTRTLQARNNLAAVLVRSKKHEEAAREFAEIAAIYERTLGKDHHRTLLLRNNLANTTMRAGRPAEALAMYRDFMPVAERVFPKKDGDLASFKMGYAVTLIVLGRRAEGEPMLVAAHKQLVETFGPKEPRVKMAEARLAELRATGTIKKTM